MKIRTLKSAIRLCRAAEVTPFIWGHRGLGKSSVVKQITEELGIGFVDFRCSQIEASDLRGLPDKENGQTCFLPPKDLPTAATAGNGGIVFLDELNRAQDDVLQAVFQLVLDGRIGTYVLPKGWSVVAAGNFGNGYIVSGFNDAAFLNRFCHLTFAGGETTLDEWVAYVQHRHGDFAARVIEFASQNCDHLDGKIEGNMDFSIQPSRRSWEMVIKVCKAASLGESMKIKTNREVQGVMTEVEDTVTVPFDDATRQEVLAGLIGRQLALSYARYDLPVKPRQLLEDGVRKHVDVLKSLDRNAMTGLMWGLVSILKPSIHEDKHARCAIDFALWMCHEGKEKDVVVAFCRSMAGENTGGEADRLRVAAVSNPKLAKLFAQLKTSDQKKTFIDRLNEHPELQEVLSKVSWGTDDEEKKEKDKEKAEKKTA